MPRQLLGWRWFVYGSGVILAVNLFTFIFSESGGNPLFPVTTQMFLGWHLIGFAYFAVLPLAYMAMLAAFSRNAGTLSKTVIGIGLVLSVLNVANFTGGWELSVHFQGRSYAVAVAIENALVLCACIGTGAVGLLRRSQTLAGAANLVLFVGLAWCFLPGLGPIE